MGWARGTWGVSSSLAGTGGAAEWGTWLMMDAVLGAGLDTSSWDMDQAGEPSPALILAMPGAAAPGVARGWLGGSRISASVSDNRSTDAGPAGTDPGTDVGLARLAGLAGADAGIANNIGSCAA